MIQARPPDQAPLAFLNIPRTAAATIGKALVAAFPAEATVELGDILRRPSVVAERLDQMSSRADVRLVSGIAPLSLLQSRLPDGTQYVSAFREPFDRTLNHFRWLHEGASDLTLASAFESRRLLDNLTTRLLCGVASPHDELPTDALTRAWKAVQGLALVCLAERLPESLALLEPIAGVRFPPLGRVRRPEARRHGLSDDEVVVLEAQTELDRELYSRTVQLFEEKQREAGQELNVQLARLAPQGLPWRKPEIGGRRAAALARKDARARRKTRAAAGLPMQPAERVATDARAVRATVARPVRPFSSPLTVFLRLPRTHRLVLGGTAAGLLDVGDATLDPEATVERLRSVAAESNTPRFVTGTVPLALLDSELGTNVCLVTILRDPTTRVLSEYYAIVASGLANPGVEVFRTLDGPKLMPRPTPELDLRDMLRDGSYFLDNLLTRLFSGMEDIYDELPDDAIDRAIDSIADRFDLVGIAERAPETLALLSAQLGPRVQLQAPAMDAPTREMLLLIEQYNELDAELYRFARKQFDQGFRRVNRTTAAEASRLREQALTDAAHRLEVRFPGLRGAQRRRATLVEDGAGDASRPDLTIAVKGRAGGIGLFGFDEPARERLRRLAAPLELIESPPPLYRFENVLFRPRTDTLYDETGRCILESTSSLRGPYLQDVVRKAPPLVPVPRRPRLHAEPLVFVGGTMRRHWGVFLTESAGRLWPLLGGDVPDEVQILGPSLAEVGQLEDAQKAPFISHYLDGAGIAKNRFVHFTEPTLLHEVYVPHPTFAIQGLAFDAHRLVAERIAKNLCGSTKQTNRPVYLSRSKLGTTFQRYYGEEALEQALAAEGVQIVHPQELDFAAQVRLFNEHSVVLGCIGSAFHSLLFTLPDRSVRTVVITNDVSVHLPTYFLVDLVKNVDANYVYVEALDRPGEKPVGTLDLETTLAWLRKLDVL